jgi:hypothetical protein
VIWRRRFAAPFTFVFLGSLFEFFTVAFQLFGVSAQLLVRFFAAFRAHCRNGERKPKREVVSRTTAEMTEVKNDRPADWLPW